MSESAIAQSRGKYSRLEGVFRRDTDTLMASAKALHDIASGFENDQIPADLMMHVSVLARDNEHSSIPSWLKIKINGRWRMVWASKAYGEIFAIDSGLYVGSDDRRFWTGAGKEFNINDDWVMEHGQPKTFTETGFNRLTSQWESWVIEKWPLVLPSGVSVRGSILAHRPIPNHIAKARQGGSACAGF